MGKVKTTTVAGGSAGFGLVVGFISDPQKGLKVLDWFSSHLAPETLIAVLTLSVGLFIAVATNWLMWERLKEKDLECQGELQRQRCTWKAVVDSKEAANKELAETVVKFVVQLTTLTERFNSLPARKR